MGESCDRKRERQHTACIVCTFLLVGFLLLLLILYFSLFKPKDPRVQVPTMQLLSYSPLSNNIGASLSLNLQVTMYNPNRADFIIQDGSTACLYYNNQQVGFTPIPRATIPAQSFSTTSVRLSSSTPLPLIPDAYIAPGGTVNDNGMPGMPEAAANVLPISTSVTIVGQVTTVDLFSHHSDVVSKCKVALSVGTSGSASIQSYSCQSSYSLDD
ncbi:hypothetical protein GOP47_0006645 [Adiantum capillus-veneris]|uniref:Late embryogenesis abundant protein LEA-2 subgroup domain-containing protein n=1 Tax=Adiantum capillus-veneris TaxID=13818 RepID=A0A9D4V394_ADICA|nr:hypothetical protein GOP47_0006645 [Adiantum capillus-veneris]